MYLFLNIGLYFLQNHTHTTVSELIANGSEVGYHLIVVNLKAGNQLASYLCCLKIQLVFNCDWSLFRC